MCSHNIDEYGKPSSWKKNNGFRRKTQYNRYQPGAVGDGANVVEYEGVRAKKDINK